MSTLFKQANQIIESGDRSYETFQRLQQIGEKSTGDDTSKIGDLIEAFIVSGGEVIQSDDDLLAEVDDLLAELEEPDTKRDWDDTFPSESDLTDDWQQSVTPAYKSLIEAEPVEDEDDETLSNAIAAGILLTIWLYSRDTGRYLKPQTRKPLSDRELDLILSDRISDTKKRLDKISKQYQKTGNTDQWENDALEIIRRSHLESYVLGRGGLNAIADDDIERLRQILNQQAQFLKTFRGELDDLTPLRIENRLRMYAQSALSSYSAGKDAAMLASGYQFEVWTLSNAEHCEDCKRLSKLGKVPIGTLPAIGTQQCLFNCKCSKAYYKT